MFEHPDPASMPDCPGWPTCTGDCKLCEDYLNFLQEQQQKYNTKHRAKKPRMTPAGKIDGIQFYEGKIVKPGAKQMAGPALRKFNKRWHNCVAYLERRETNNRNVAKSRALNGRGDRGTKRGADELSAAFMDISV